MALSAQSLDAFADVSTGGSGNSTKLSIGLNRSAWYIERFMNDAGHGHGFGFGGASRVPALRSYLNDCAPALTARLRL